MCVEVLSLLGCSNVWVCGSAFILTGSTSRRRDRGGFLDSEDEDTKDFRNAGGRVCFAQLRITSWNTYINYISAVNIVT